MLRFPPSAIRLLQAACILASAPLLSSCYVLSQGTRYLSLQSRAHPLDRVIADPKTDLAIRTLIERAEAVREFAKSGIGLSESRNFTTFVKLDKPYLADVVSACAPLAFTRHLWRYPVVGALPYKGFFDRKDAEAEAARLRARGLDVLVRQVDAFSTLGWFRDPLWSFMADYPPGALAEVLIHELAHASVFAKGRDAFNEAFASFIGVEGAKAWLRESYGSDSPELRSYGEQRDDAARFAAFLAETARQLELVYASEESEDSKRSGKAERLRARADEYALEREAFAGEAYRSFPMEKVDNAVLDLYRMYEPDAEFYSTYLERVSGGSLSALVADARAAAAEGGDPEAVLRERLASEYPAP